MSSEEPIGANSLGVKTRLLLINRPSRRRETHSLKIPELQVVRLMNQHPVRQLRKVNPHTVSGLCRIWIHGYQRSLFFPLAHPPAKTNRADQEASKESEWTQMTKVLGEPGSSLPTKLHSDKRVETISEVSLFRAKVDYFQTDTSEAEDVLDSAGTVPACNQPNVLDSGFGELTSSEQQFPHTPEANDTANLSANSRILGDKQQLSASGRTLLRKYFSETELISLLMGHPTVAFSERQIQIFLTNQLPYPYAK